MIRQAFGEESMSHKWKVQNQRDQKKARQMKSKVKSMLIIFFHSKGIVHKEFILADQTVNFTYYCNILWRMHENLPQTMATKELAVMSCTVSCFPFHQAIFDPKST
jgi:hypothetical protein